MSEDEDDGESTHGLTVREGPGGPRHGRAASTFDEGTTVGRYVVQNVLGRGGMGVVYAAHDPELGRKVAVKLLSNRSIEGSRGPEHQAWLVREAQALARLSHPNVVAVHDVGTTGDQVFLAMEHVDGQTLRDWLDAKRDWREIVAKLRGAAAGLHAAHVAGLVHRDFKPDNVLVATDGRVRVMDFGLAREQASRAQDPPAARISDLSISTRSPLPSNLTADGDVLGTPAYMAPELYDGTPANALSDQFAFGVTLYEALYGERPYRKVDLQLPRTQPLVPRPPPASSHVPARIARVAMRAIDPDPAKRYASLEALRAELIVDEPVSRAATAIRVGLATAVFGGTAIFIAAHAASPTPECTGIDTRIGAVWNAETKAAISGAFAGSKRPYAAATYTGIERALDGYAQDWLTSATESCRATRVRKEQTEAVLELRTACLDQRLDELHALTGMLVKADAALVDKADQAAWALQPIARCSNVTALLAPGLPPRDKAAAITAIKAKLAEANASFVVGHFPDAHALLETTYEQALATEFAPIIADTQLLRGKVLVASGDPTHGREALENAAYVALRGKADDVVVDAGLHAARTIAEELGKPGEADIWLNLSRATLARMGGDRTLEAFALESEGIVAAASGDLREAVAAHKRSLAAAEGLHGKDDPGLWRANQILAATLAKSGEYAAATPYYEHALALLEKSVGPDHPDVALILSSLGACYDHAGDAKRARATLERALTIRETSFGDASPKLVATLNNLADFLRSHGDLDAALSTIQRAKTIATVAPGTGHPLYHIVATTFGQVLRDRGHLDEARTELDAVLAIEEPAKSPILPTTLTERAAVELAAHAYELAATFDRRAITAFEAAGGDANPELWRPLADLARAQQALGDATGARANVARAIQIGEAAKLADNDLKPLRALAASL